MFFSKYRANPFARGRHRNVDTLEVEGLRGREKGEGEGEKRDKHESQAISTVTADIDRPVTTNYRQKEGTSKEMEN